MACQYYHPRKSLVNVRGDEDLLNKFLFIHTAVDVSLHHVLGRRGIISKPFANKLGCESRQQAQVRQEVLLTLGFHSKAYPINRPKPT